MLAAPRFVPTRFTVLENNQVAVGETWEDLRAIREANVNLAIMKRPAARIPHATAELFQKNFDHFQTAMTKDEDPVLLGAHMEDELELEAPDAGDLYCDMIEALREFLRISEANEIGVRLEAVATDMCALFHCDWVPLRLVCTYEGPGTQWLFDKDANREGLLKGDNDLVLRPHATVQALRAGEIGIMKGAKFPKAGARALIHRSPPIQGTGIKRLIMRMDVLA